MRDLANTVGAPITSLDDPRVTDAAREQLNEWQRGFVEGENGLEIDQSLAGLLGESYFNSEFVTKPEPPLPTPPWARSKWAAVRGELSGSPAALTLTAESPECRSAGVSGTVTQRFAIDLESGKMTVDPPGFFVYGGVEAFEIELEEALATRAVLERLTGRYISAHQAVQTVINHEAGQTVIS